MQSFLENKCHCDSTHDNFAKSVGFEISQKLKIKKHSDEYAYSKSDKHSTLPAVKCRRVLN